ncbi:MAG: phosphatase PAP2 family protein [bacterium]|nr:MAG: phosphatase PAP2 family protein [bacterium]
MKKLPKKYLVVFVEIVALVLLTLIISTFNLDIKLQKLFYQANSSSSEWYQKENPFWQFGYHYGTLPAILLTFAALIGFILSWIKPKIKNFQRHFLLIILTLFIGPGLLVNAIFKDHWGRPRPRQVQEFGGRWEFKEVWQPGTPGKGKSFPCGHCSMGFFFITLYYCFKRKHKLLAYSSFVFSIALGMFIGFARISQGGHFLSDVLWSWGLTYLTATVLYYFILKIPDYELQYQTDQKIQAPVKSSPQKRALVTIGVVVSIAIMIFTFLFSKPFYKESIHEISANNLSQIIMLHLDINRGDIFIHSGKFELPVKIKTTARGFGFPKYKYQSQLSKHINNDTLVANYSLNIKGLFNEIDAQTLIYVDSSSSVYLENHLHRTTKVSNKHNQK